MQTERELSESWVCHLLAVCFRELHLSESHFLPCDLVTATALHRVTVRANEMGTRRGSLHVSGYLYYLQYHLESTSPPSGPSCTEEEADGPVQLTPQARLQAQPLISSLLAPRCCLAHDCCYEKLKQLGCQPVLSSYQFRIVNGTVACE